MNDVSNFDRKKLLITGGTGSFGQAVLKRFLTTNIDEIRIFSRDELKQDEIRQYYKCEKLKFYIGDVRDKGSIDDAMQGVDFVFHAAALKQVPSCEFYPMQAVQTNVIGTENVLNSAIKSQVKKVICLSTDKAVYPINAMGMSKAMMERVAIAKSRNTEGTLIACTRYGNVMASRGSVIPLFIEQIKRCQNLTVTDPNMTRFMMSLDDAVDLVLYAFLKAHSGDIFVQKSPAASVGVLAAALILLFKAKNRNISIIGSRHGEKLYETLLTNEEMLRAIEMNDYFRIPSDGRDLNYGKFVDHGMPDLKAAIDYNSHNAQQLQEDEVINLLKSLPEINRELKKLGVK